MATSIFSDLEGIVESGYIEPKTIREACSLLSQYKGRAKVIAGGTKLLALMKKGKISPEFIINLNSIPELEYINYSDADGLTIGALTTLTYLQNSPIVREKFAIVAQATHEMKPVNIPRWAYYMATIGGTLSTPVPSADITTVLIALGAKAKIAGPKGWSTISLGEFFTSSGETILHEDEILTEIQVPKQPANIGNVYTKLSATKDAPAIGVAVLAMLDSKHVNLDELRIVLGGITSTPIRAQKAEATAKGKAVDEHLIKETAQAAVSSIANEHRKQAEQLVTQAISQAIEDAIGDFAMGY